MRFAPTFALALTLAACALEEPVLEIPAREASTLILIFGSPPEARIFDLSDETVSKLTVSRTFLGEHALYAAYYPCRPAALGLRAGAASFAARGLELATASELYTAAPRSSLEPLATLPAELASLRIESTIDPTCPALGHTEVTIPARSPADEVRFVVALDETRALYATAGGNFATIESGAATPLTNLATTTPNLGAVVLDDGEVWLAGRNGAIAAGTIERGFTARTARTSTRGYTRIWLDGTADDLFLVTDDRSFEHFDGRVWTILYEGTAPRSNSRAGVLRLGPGEAIAVGPDPQRIIRRRAGVTSFEALPAGAPISLALTRELGAVAGSDLGALFRRDASGWVPIDASSPAAVLSIVELDETIIFGGDKGVFYRFVPGAPSCGMIQLAPSDVDLAARAGSTAFLLANVVGESDVITEVRLEQLGCGGGR